MQKEVGSERVISRDGVVRCEDSAAHTIWDTAAGYSNTMEGVANLSGARGGGKGSSGVSGSWLDRKGPWRQGEQPQQRLGVGAGHQGPLVQGAAEPRVYTQVQEAGPDLAVRAASPGGLSPFLFL